MKLVMLSWRYLGHPQGGGAELVAHEVLRRCVEKGWDVTVFTATYPGAAPTDELDGVKIVRRGVQHTVHLRAWRWLAPRLGDFDRVVEQMNTLPFLTPLYVPASKRRLLIFQLAREYWFRETRGMFRLARHVGYALEPWQMRLYRRTPTMTISESSRADLEALGVPVTAIIPMAVNTPAVVRLEPPADQLRLVVVGRLTPAKFVEEGVESFGFVQSNVPDAALDIVGDGPPAYRHDLERLVRMRGLRDVTFHGRVSESRKRELLERAHFHVFASHREGWGLTVTEAARVGTPTVGYDAPGVRDSIANPRLIARTRTPAGLAERIVELYRDPDRYQETREDAWQRARDLSWDRTSAAFMEAVR